MFHQKMKAAVGGIEEIRELTNHGFGRGLDQSFTAQDSWRRAREKQRTSAGSGQGEKEPRESLYECPIVGAGQVIQYNTKGLASPFCATFVQTLHWRHLSSRHRGTLFASESEAHTCRYFRQRYYHKTAFGSTQLVSLNTRRYPRLDSLHSQHRTLHCKLLRERSLSTAKKRLDRFHLNQPHYPVTCL